MHRLLGGFASGEMFQRTPKGNQLIFRSSQLSVIFGGRGQNLSLRFEETTVEAKSSRFQD